MDRGGQSTAQAGTDRRAIAWTPDGALSRLSGGIPGLLSGIKDRGHHGQTDLVMFRVPAGGDIPTRCGAKSEIGDLGVLLDLGQEQLG